MMNESLTKEELDRIRKANELKEVCRKNPSKYKLAYFEGGNLVLLKKGRLVWEMEDQTGIWFRIDEMLLTN